MNFWSDAEFAILLKHQDDLIGAHTALAQAGYRRTYTAVCDKLQSYRRKQKGDRNLVERNYVPAG